MTSMNISQGDFNKKVADAISKRKSPGRIQEGIGEPRLPQWPNGKESASNVQELQ